MYGQDKLNGKASFENECAELQNAILAQREKTAELRRELGNDRLNQIRYMELLLAGEVKICDDLRIEIEHLKASSLAPASAQSNPASLMLGIASNVYPAEPAPPSAQ
ncbi:unnamed protein product [Bursaphelenchus okinawaensis]|uniref:Uncharacterized protein n=1 Tax=Bursaphelenchus okinawaensis TaxID=465554 RepID=A0A811KTF3_9BILA|nr:unnamed protein product [Bursaphelenchus okinawaensis]CAG9110885.1 unnamed protein product [Bursaphelenchus okinawaensis]